MRKIYKEINIILSDCENWKYPIEWIKNEYENGNSLSELGNWYFSSFLPSKTIAIYYTLISEDLFIEKIEDNELLVKSENKKIGFIYIQIIIFFCSTFYFYSVLFYFFAV